MDKKEGQIHIDPKIKEAIKVAKDVVLHVISYWYLLIIFLILAFIISKVLKKAPEVKYIAPLTFTINQAVTAKTSTESSDVARLITDFGLNTGGGERQGVNASRLIELSKSNAVLTEVLFRKYAINGDTNYLANHFRNIHNENVTDSSYFKNFVSIDSLNRGQNAVLNSIINEIKTSHISFTISPSQIFRLSIQSSDEQFSKTFAEGFYEALSELYVKGAISKAQATYDFAENRLEIATEQMLSAERSLASWQDRNQNLIKRSAHLTEIELERKVSIYNGVYFEALKSYEAAKINLENQRPIFQMIDPPRYPLQRETTSTSNIRVFAVIGAIAFFLFITVSLYFYKQYGYLIKELFEE
ncbi:MAG: hypothetical protein R2753_13600 [Chitinophagales bacterium]